MDAVAYCTGISLRKLQAVGCDGGCVCEIRRSLGRPDADFDVELVPAAAYGDAFYRRDIAVIATKSERKVTAAGDYVIGRVEV